ncbi:MAG: hypothetical protein LBD53_01385 [Tannerella sp.]|jgi:hypothetical protein|nr:hypothetical protein [Tannerella sp.]
MRTIFIIYLFCLTLAGSSVAAQNQNKEATESIIKTKRSRFVVGIRSGYSHMLASADAGIKDAISAGATQQGAENYYDKLKKGFHFSADAHYMIVDFVGAGVKYSLFSSSSDIDMTAKASSSYSILPPPSYLYYCIGYDERMYVNFVAPSFVFRQRIGKTARISEKIAVGYAGYRSEVRAKADLLPTQKYSNMLAEGGNIALNPEVMFEVFPTKWLSVGLSAGYFNFTVKKMKLKAQSPGSTSLDIIETEIKLEKDKYETLSRIDLSLGLNFHF